MIPDASTHKAFGIDRGAHVNPIRSPLQYGMVYGPRADGVPNVPPPMARSSLAQRILIHRTQISRYISQLSPAMSLVPLAGYPYAGVIKQVHLSPQANQTPILSTFPATAGGGTMAAPSRFTKALPYPIQNYQPPTY